MAAFGSTSSWRRGGALAMDDDPRASFDQAWEKAVRAGGQTARDREQTLSDRDQTATDRDQTANDHDQEASDSDQRSADEDQEVADQNLDPGSDRGAHDRAARARRETAADREAASRVRAASSADRLDAASERDVIAAWRDRAADGRDAAARVCDDEGGASETRGDVVSRAQRDRGQAAADRERAADDRTRAAGDRDVAAAKRAVGQQTRAASAVLLQQATTDELTGARTRFLGLDEAARELQRARRTGGPPTIAFVDIDGLKRINDTQGHLAGDEVLRIAGETLLANLRPYDVVVRFGGDEFLCVLPNCALADAKTRLERLADVFHSAEPRSALSYGLAQAEPAEQLQSVIARADEDLLRRRAAADHGEPRPRERPRRDGAAPITSRAPTD